MTAPESIHYTPAGVPQGTVAPSARERRKAFSGAIAGHLIEWYDYGIYGFLAVYIGANFFISDDPVVGLVSTFAVFALSFVIRPLGGLFFGPLADKIGRRNTLLIVLTTMCTATMLIGLLPTAHTVGALAPVLLVLMRLVQGFSAGGEVSTMTAFISEFAKKGSRGLATSFLMVTAAAGLLIGAVVANGLSVVLGEEAMHDGGWRIPFLVAGPLGAVAVVIRMKLEDSPEFKALKRENKTAKAPLREVFRYPRQLLLTIAVIALLTSSFYLVATYLTTYLNAILGFPWETTFAYVLLAGVVGMVMMPVGGYITDRIGDRRVFLLVMAVLLIGAFFWFFLTAPHATPAQLLWPLIALAVCYGLYCGAPYATMSELLPAHIRSTGLALGYNLPVAIFGGSAPFIASSLISGTGSISSPVWYFAGTGVVSLIGLLMLRQRDLLGSDGTQTAGR